jgi:hypothetical protein
VLRRVRDVQIVLRVQGKPVRSSPIENRTDRAVGRNFSHAVVSVVGNKKIAIRIHRYIAWTSKVRSCRQTSITAEPSIPGASDCVDDSIECDFPDAIQSGVGNVDVTYAVYGDIKVAPIRPKLGGDSPSTVAVPRSGSGGVYSFTCSRDSRDFTAGADPPQPVILGIGDV